MTEKPPLPPPPNDPSAYSPKGDVVTQPNGRLIRAVEQEDGSIVVYVKPYQGQGEVPELILSVIDGSAMTAAQVTGSGLIAAEVRAIDGCAICDSPDADLDHRCTDAPHEHVWTRVAGDGEDTVMGCACGATEAAWS